LLTLNLLPKYVLPQSFDAHPIVYSSLNLIRLVNESAVARSGKLKGEGVSRGAWNSYNLFLRRRSKLLDTLLTFLNVTWTVEVPIEMLVERLLGLSAKLRYVVILELLKAASRLYVFVMGGWRPVLRHFLPDVVLEQIYPSGEDAHGELIQEIKMSGEGKEEEGVRNFLRKHRVDAYVLVPELSVIPAKSFVERAREIAHILRPLVYTTLLAASITRKEKGGKLQWSAWTISLAMDLFSEWPQVKDLVLGKSSKAMKESMIEKNEKQVRMIKLLFYLLRNPFYSAASQKYLDSVSETLGQWRILRPLVGTDPSKCLFL
jgi:hypothetical protein